MFELQTQTSLIKSKISALSTFEELSKLRKRLKTILTRMLRELREMIFKIREDAETEYITPTNKNFDYIHTFYFENI
jgi:hypothetical protein